MRERTDSRTTESNWAVPPPGARTSRNLPWGSARSFLLRATRTAPFWKSATWSLVMSTPSTLSADLLSPVTPEKPVGDDLYPTTEWLSIREARPDPYETGNMGIWAPLSPTQASWPLLRERAASALLRRSKDLRIATLLA